MFRTLISEQQARFSRILKYEYSRGELSVELSDEQLTALVSDSGGSRKVVLVLPKWENFGFVNIATERARKAGIQVEILEGLDHGAYYEDPVKVADVFADLLLAE